MTCVTTPGRRAPTATRTGMLFMMMKSTHVSEVNNSVVVTHSTHGVDLEKHTYASLGRPGY